MALCVVISSFNAYVVILVHTFGGLLFTLYFLCNPFFLSPHLTYTYPPIHLSITVVISSSYTSVICTETLVTDKWTISSLSLDLSYGASRISALIHSLSLSHFTFSLPKIKFKTCDADYFLC